ncbi:MAG: hypothetical protein KF883_14050 [Thermomicrobiales bacterium]|nr:hypothetical protein [Thermomicrobiales bacterium]
MAQTEGYDAQTEGALKQIDSKLATPLTPAERAEVGERLGEFRERFGRLRQFPLSNGDEPAPGFHPYRKAGR